MNYLIGQRVILNDKEIGTVEAPSNYRLPNTEDKVWVFSPSHGYSSYYSTGNIKPLPGGQL